MKKKNATEIVANYADVDISDGSYKGSYKSCPTQHELSTFTANGTRGKMHSLKGSKGGGGRKKA